MYLLPCLRRRTLREASLASMLARNGKLGPKHRYLQSHNVLSQQARPRQPLQRDLVIPINEARPIRRFCANEEPLPPPVNLMHLELRQP